MLYGGIFTEITKSEENSFISDGENELVIDFSKVFLKNEDSIFWSEILLNIAFFFIFLINRLLLSFSISLVVPISKYFQFFHYPKNHLLLKPFPFFFFELLDQKICFDLNYKCFCSFDWLRGTDLNRRPSGYEPDELPDCSTPRYT